MPESPRSPWRLDIDLQQGVVPISRAASSLAALLKHARASHQPIIITQKGYPSAVLLDIELYTRLCRIAELHRQQRDDETQGP